MKYAVLILLGLVIGFILNDTLKEPLTIVKTETVIETDTVFVEVEIPIYITKTEIKHEVLRDTVLIEPIQPQIKLFTASKPFLYGNVSIKGEVLGQILKMDIYQNFKYPTITNNITTTNTVLKKPAGLFVTAGYSQTPYVGAIFVKDKYLLGLNTSGFQIGYKLSK